MPRLRKRWRTIVGGVSGLVCGVAGGTAAIALLASGATGSATGAEEAFLTAAHVPPLLTLPGEKVTLRYAIVCPPPGGDASEPCNGSGAVYIRAGNSGPFSRLALRRGNDAAEGRWFAEVPETIADSPDGFSYYAVVRNAATGGSLTVPAGGADAPQRSYRLARPTTIDLAAHAFGLTRPHDARVVVAAWGSGARDVGLSGGVESSRLGPSSFDVGRDGTVMILDQNNSRLVRWRGGRAASVPVDVPAAIDDMSVAPDGTVYIVDGRSDRGTTPILRTFAADGTLQSARHIAERTWSQLRVGTRGPVIQSEPSEQWLPGSGRRGIPGRPLADGSQVVVLRTGIGELRVAHVAGGAVRQSWRVVSATPLGEVQLADVIGTRLVVVVKTYNDTHDEFEALVLDGSGVVQDFSIPAAEWAESAPLARFRLVGSSLYQFGSTPGGAFVDRYDLGGAQ